MDLSGHPVIDIVLPTYRMEPEENERFYSSKARIIADKIIAEELREAVYDEDEAKTWSLNISDKVREAVVESLGKSSRFKVVVQTTIGQLKDQGVRVASRCLWDPTTDNYAACSFSNKQEGTVIKTERDGSKADDINDNGNGNGFGNFLDT